jgi:hypothetical protein
MVCSNEELTIALETSEHSVIRVPILSSRADDQRVFAAGLQVADHRFEGDDESYVREEEDCGFLCGFHFKPPWASAIFWNQS